jgi:two-component system response regulator HydG
MSEPAAQALLEYSWPGNVRELRTAVEHGVVLSRSQQIELKDLPPALRSKGAPGPASVPHGKTLNLEALEKQSIVKALEQSGGNRTEAAKALGLSRRTLHRKLKHYGLESQ